MKELNEYRTHLIDKLAAAAKDFQAACLAVKDPFAALDEGGWNVHQLAAHTRDVDKLVYGIRAQKTAQEDNPEFQNFDGDAVEIPLGHGLRTRLLSRCRCESEDETQTGNESEFHGVLPRGQFAGKCYPTVFSRALEHFAAIRGERRSKREKAPRTGLNAIDSRSGGSNLADR